MSLPPEIATFFARFENLFQLWLHGEVDPRAQNEEIERVYRHLQKHKPIACRHGRTLLTCPECYLTSFNDRGNAI